MNNTPRRPPQVTHWFLRPLLALAVCVCLSAAGTGKVHAVPLSPVSHDMLNGETGAFNYWDKFYTGSGATMTDLAPYREASAT